MITVSYDDSTGVIRTVTYGRTSREEIEDYLLRLCEAIARADRDWGRVLHLVDASQLELQSDENLRCLAGAAVDLQEGEGKTAVVMTSQRAISQLDHMPSQMATTIFPDYASAKAWLFADSSGDCEPLAA